MPPCIEGVGSQQYQGVGTRIFLEKVDKTCKKRISTDIEGFWSLIIRIGRMEWRKWK
jgi:hypothetical protein